MMIEFVKMHGLGNDFMVIDATKAQVPLSPLQIQKLANRRTGVGFDQLLVIEKPEAPAPLRPAAPAPLRPAALAPLRPAAPAPLRPAACPRDPAIQADFYCRIFNADGSSAEQCGNGVRCVGRLILDEKLHDGDSIRLQTDGGMVLLQGMENGDMRVNMGAPIFEPTEIPVQLDQDRPLHKHQVMNRDVCFSVVNMGNPHAVIQVEQLCEQDVSLLGQALGSDSIFPEGVNVGFSQIVSPQNLLLQVYERGAGETLACGSGACAAVVAGRRLGHLQEQVRVEQPGGSLMIEWQGPGQPVWMTGPATTVFKGRLTEGF